MSSPNDPTTTTDPHVAHPPAAQGDRPAPVDYDTTYSQGNETATAVRDEVGRVAADARQSLGEARDAAKQEAGRRYEQVQDFTRRAGDEARRQADRARDQYEGAKRQLASQFNEGKKVAGERVASYVTDGKRRLNVGVSDLAAAARAAAGELHKRDDKTVAGYAEAAATSLERVRDYVEHTEPADLLRELGGLTRRRPEWVLGGAFLVGLGISRFLKADQPHARGLPEGADESLFDDAVASQRTGGSYGGRRHDEPMGDLDASAPFAMTAPVGLDEPAGHLPPDIVNDDAAPASTDDFAPAPTDDYDPITPTDDLAPPSTSVVDAGEDGTLDPAADAARPVDQDEAAKTGASNTPPIR